MAKNLSSIPPKIAGSLHYASELEIMRGFIDSPQQSLGTFNPSAITLDGSGVYSAYTSTGNITFAFTGTPVNANWHKVKITLNGIHTLTVPSGSVILNSSFTDGAAPTSGVYDLWIAYIDGEYQFNLVSRTLKAADYPTILSMTVEDGAANSVIVNFNQNVAITNQTGWTFRINATGDTLTGVSGTGTSQLTFTCTTAVQNGDTLDMSYDSGTGNCVASDDSAPLQSFTQTAVTNNVAAAATPLPQITGLTAANITGTRVYIGWDATSGNESSISVERSVTGADTWSEIATPATSTTEIEDTVADSSVAYEYRAKEVGDGVTYSDGPVSTASDTEGFLPSDITSVGLFLDGEDDTSMTIEDTNRITVLPNKSTNRVWTTDNCNFIATTGTTARPTYSSANKEIQFDGVNNYLSGQNNGTDFTESLGEIIHITKTAQTAACNIFGMGGSGSSSVAFITAFNSSASAGDTWVTSINADTSNVVATTEAVASSYKMRNIISNDSLYSFYVNDVSDTPVVIAGTNDGDWTGQVSNRTQLFIASSTGPAPAVKQLDLKLLIYSNAVLTTQQRTDIYNWSVRRKMI